MDSRELNVLGKPYGSYDPSYRLRHSPPSIERLYKPFRSEVKAACFARVKLDGKGETKTGNGQEDFAWGATEAEDSTEAATAETNKSTPVDSTEKARAKSKVGPAGPDVENIARFPAASDQQRARDLIVLLADSNTVTTAVDMLLAGDSNFESARSNIADAYGRLMKAGKKH